MQGSDTEQKQEPNTSEVSHTVRLAIDPAKHTALYLCHLPELRDTALLATRCIYKHDCLLTWV